MEEEHERDQLFIASPLHEFADFDPQFGPLAVNRCKIPDEGADRLTENTGITSLCEPVSKRPILVGVPQDLRERAGRIPNGLATQSPEKRRDLDVATRRYGVIIYVIHPITRVTPHY